MPDGKIDLIFDDDTHEAVLRIEGPGGGVDNHRVPFSDWERWIRMAESVTRDKKNEWEIKRFVHQLQERRRQREAGLCESQEFQNAMNDLETALNNNLELEAGD